MRTKLELVGSGFLDMYDDVPISLNYSVADISEPDKRQASYSKTITLPGTTNNNKLFGYIFEIDIYSNFNPTIKKEATLYVDGLENMNGYLRLTNIITNENKIEYSVTIIANVGNVFTVIGDSYLTDLDISALNHTYDNNAQVNSWFNYYSNFDYVYPMIDYGFNNGIDWEVQHFFPAVGVKYYIDKIFAAAGYTYTSAFFTSTIFKHLIIPYSGSGFRLTEAEITARNCSVAKTFNQSITASVFAKNWDNVIFESLTADPSSLWQYNYFQPITTNSMVFDVSLNFSANVAVIIEVAYYESLSTPPKVLYNYAYSNFSGAATTVTFKTNPYLILSGRAVVLRARLQTAATTATILAASTFKATVASSVVQEGTPLNMNLAIPKNIKQRDFFTSLIKMFNLYIDTDKSNPKNLIIEPRDDFYTLGSTKDWTSKLDTLKGVTSLPVGAINAKKYIYAYKSDKDYYNSIYEKTYGEPYGTRTIDTINDFIQGEKKTDIIFSPTPIAMDNYTGRKVSSISASSVSTTSATHNDTNIRILYFDNIVEGNYWNKIFHGATGIRYVGRYNYYPCATHLNSPYVPTFDLNFGVPKTVYYATGVYTSNNLFNLYHKKFLEEIIDYNSKIVTMYIHLTAVDIATLDFKNLYFIDGHLFKLNKVIDYNPLSSGSTKCEFLKSKDKPAFSSTSTSSVGGGLVSMNNTTII